jgi:NAD(P)-dependent dehydrogenase (short-subunit alcohol dehydrogenase family)
MKPDGASAIVTGGSSGLGAAVTAALCAAGAHVVVLDRTAPPEKTVHVSCVEGDVRSEADVATAIAEASLLGPLRILVNCAGIGNAIRTVGAKGTFPLAEFERIVSVNLVGTFNAIRLCAAAMAGNEILDGGERGVIVNTASVAAFDGQVGQAAYAASKAGIVGLTLPVARDLADLQIRVATIAPGLFETPLLAQLPLAARESLGQQVPHPRRLGHPNEFAALVMHIIDNPMLNGEVIRLDGAIRMAPR